MSTTRDNPTNAEIDLSAVPFFNAFPQSALDELMKTAARRKFRNHSNIVVAGEPSHTVYVLIGGSVQIFTDDDKGDEFVIDTLGPGDCFGELGVLDGQARTANVMATSECDCLMISGKALQAALDSDPTVRDTIIRGLVGRIRAMTDAASSLALLDVYGRIVKVLESNAQTDEGGVPTVSKMTHQELAKRVGSSREMVSRILKDLRKGGYITNEKQQIRIEKDLPARW